ncbi:MAG: DNA photolyase [candidate division KSB1 bacterium]|nr:DNA photolyase [candidate division KSB1 bacterium]
MPAVFHPRIIFVEEAVSRSPLAQRVLQQFPDVPVEPAEADALLSGAAGRTRDLRGAILLAKQRGPFLRLCPGTKHHLCCLYHNLDVVAGCDLDCSYCVLQGYLNTPLITVYCNWDDLFAELEKKFSSLNSFFRVGTGELSDSLTFEPFLNLAPELVSFFAERRNAVLELKSKNVFVENLLGLRHNRRTIVSWSMNAEAVYQSDEGTSASPQERLQAAQKVQEAGYRLGFHFDPMIWYPKWEEGYREIVDQIFRVIRPQNIAWISLGALRYPAAFDDVIRKNHPQSRIYLGELLPGIDKKLRYFKPLRIEMFAKMYSWIRSYTTEAPVYLCMESAEVWRRSFGWAPRSSAQLKRLLDDRVRE